MDGKKSLSSGTVLTGSAKLEKPEAKPRGATLKMIAEALKISVAQLDL